jgi:phosphoribosylformylglycinamidine cyclo-ligase
MRGVSASKEDVHRAILNTNKGLFPNAFCKIMPDILGGNSSYCNIMHADGAGTKSSLAYVYWRETGDLSVWRGIAQDALVMNVDDLLCVGNLNHILVSSTIGRNKRFISGEVISEIIDAMHCAAEDIRAYGIPCHITGGETADVGDLVRTIIIDTTVCSRMKRKDVIDNGAIAIGDVVVGLASDGQSFYEDNHNSGIGSNGLTFARHELFAKYLAKKYPESFDPDIPASLVYSGKLRLDEAVAGLIPNAGLAALSPTRTYVPVFVQMFEEIERKDIHGIIHCTGGGQTKVLRFIKEKRVVKNNLFTPPPIFQKIMKNDPSIKREMYQVFNMGHRMEIYAAPETADTIIKISRSLKIDARIIGHVEYAQRAEVVIETENQKFTYA